MPHDVTMPQLGMAQDAGKIVAWLKAPGDAVAKGDALFEVETDKATMEVEAQAAGYLTGVVAGEGDDVPVGQVIARISDSAEDDSPAPAAPPAAAPASDALPEGKQITMPQLGMAQDSGQMVGWLVELGAQVGPDDLLFEVETDKATMEVPAGASGYLAATLAQQGEDVAVGAPVAILTTEAPLSPVARSAADAAPAQAAAPAASEPDSAPEEAAPAAEPAPAAKAGVTAEGGRILASPKARRLALEQGLDLSRLARAGHPQPFHVADLEVLRALPDDTAPQAAPVQASRRLTAHAPDGLSAFTDWAAPQVESADAILAAIAGQDHVSTVGIERFGTTKAYALPESRRMAHVTPTDHAPELILRDMRDSFVQTVEMGAEDVPVLTLLPEGDGLSLVLECAGGQLGAQAAISLLNTVAGRVAQPLRHLL
ncbi:MAG: pyruvate dehydrogenase [Alphaproteobacteria bacterium]|jgi:pyruvate dehydrogenase E2 component (dihydrolipoamide acetyltransferase)/2-oxoglutarate dehydrogenase E2 component (dihydrolipoamide succinyltransferase)|nr:pyruvate dehydrogenase [Alphaproteobacteria bacterium]